MNVLNHQTNIYSTVLAGEYLIIIIYEDLMLAEKWSKDMKNKLFLQWFYSEY